MTMLANFPLFILFYAVSPALGESRHLYRHYHRRRQSHVLYYAADLRPRTAIIWGVLMWLIFAMAKMYKH